MIGNCLQEEEHSLENNYLYDSISEIHPHPPTSSQKPLHHLSKLDEKQQQIAPPQMQAGTTNATPFYRRRFHESRQASCQNNEIKQSFFIPLLSKQTAECHPINYPVDSIGSSTTIETLRTSTPSEDGSQSHAVDKQEFENRNSESSRSSSFTSSTPINQLSILDECSTSQRLASDFDFAYATSQSESDDSNQNLTEEISMFQDSRASTANAQEKSAVAAARRRRRSEFSEEKSHSNMITLGGYSYNSQQHSLNINESASISTSSRFQKNKIVRIREGKSVTQNSFHPSNGNNNNNNNTKILKIESLRSKLFKNNHINNNNNLNDENDITGGQSQIMDSDMMMLEVHGNQLYSPSPLTKFRQNIVLSTPIKNKENEFRQTLQHERQNSFSQEQNPYYFHTPQKREASISNNNNNNNSSTISTGMQKLCVTPYLSYTGKEPIQKEHLSFSETKCSSNRIISGGTEENRRTFCKSIVCFTQTARGKFSFHKLNQQKRELSNISNNIQNGVFDPQIDQNLMKTPVKSNNTSYTNFNGSAQKSLYTPTLSNSRNTKESWQTCQSSGKKRNRENQQPKTRIYEDNGDPTATENDSPDFNCIRKYYKQKYGTKLQQIETENSTDQEWTGNKFKINCYSTPQKKFYGSSQKQKNNLEDKLNKQAQKPIMAWEDEDQN